MFYRFFMLAMIMMQVMLFASGCEQLTDYRKKAYYEKGLSLFEKQQYRDALFQTKHALEFDSDYFDAVVLRARCQYELKNYKAAAWTFEQAYLLDETRDDLFLKSAEAFFMLGNWGMSGKRTTILLKQNPDNSAARYLEVRNYLRSRLLVRWRNVDITLQPLLNDPVYSNRAFALLAEFNILNDDLQRAEQLLFEHADANDDWLYSMRRLAEKYDLHGNQEMQIRLYRKILELKPDSRRDKEHLRLMLRKFGRKEEELQLLEAMIASEPQQISYNLELIGYYLYYGNFEDAEESILAGIESGEGYVDFSRYLIELYKKTNRYSAAIQVAKDVLAYLNEEAYERKLEFMNILAWLYYEDNNSKMAKVVVRWILHINGDEQRARFLQARISLDEGRSLLAISELRGLASEHANNAEYDYYMGLAHLERFESSNAEQSFKEALKKDSNHKQALLKLSEIYFQKGFFGDVELMVNNFLAANPDDSDVLALQAEVAGRLAVAPAPVAD